MSTAQLWRSTIDEYHADGANSVSHSELACFRQDPALYHGRYITRRFPQKRKHHFEFGNVFHWITLGEPFAVDSDNFRRHTVAMFHPSPAPSLTPDYVSKSGSLYWHTSEGLYRESDHWGIVGRNFWALSGAATETAAGFCRWDRFLFQEHFVPIPDDVLAKNGARSTNAYKAFAAENAGSVLLKADEFAALAEMLASIREHDAAAELLDGDGQTEVGMKWVDEETGLVCRCRPDKLGEQFVADLKSFAGNPLDAQKLASHVENMSYATQAAWYQDGIRAVLGEDLPFFFVVVGKNGPYTCEVVALEQGWIDEAREINRNALRRFAECKASGRWVSEKHGGVTTLPRPSWAKSDKWNLELLEAEV